MQKIGILLCYFGEWPRWGDLFLESCRHNPTVDFLLLTDCEPSLPAIDHVKLVDFDLARFNALASERLGMKVELRKPYKLVDLKPAWGVIFQDYLQSYDFWGYCDLDQVFGDIRAFMTEELLETHDLLAARREFPTGHFTLFRNVETINRLYERSRDYRRAFTEETIFSFGECGRGLQVSLIQGAGFAEVASQAEVECLLHVLARSPEVRVYQETICKEQLGQRTGLAWDVLQICWERGRVVDLLTQRELMYFHLHHLTESPLFYVPRWERMPDAFLITRRGIGWVGPQELGRRLVNALLRRLFQARALIRLNYQYCIIQLRSLRRRWSAGRSRPLSAPTAEGPDFTTRLRHLPKRRRPPAPPPTGRR